LRILVAEQDQGQFDPELIGEFIRMIREENGFADEPKVPPMATA